MNKKPGPVLLPPLIKTVSLYDESLVILGKLGQGVGPHRMVETSVQPFLFFDDGHSFGR